MATPVTPDTSFLVDGFHPRVQLEDPAVVAARVQTLRNQQQQQVLNQQQIQGGQLDLQQKQRAVDEGARLRELFAQPGMTVQNALPQVMAINPQTGLSLQKGMFENQKAQLDIQELAIKNRAQQAQRLGSIGATMHDDFSYHGGIVQAAAEQLIGPDQAQALLAQGWNPQTKAQVQQLVDGSKTAVEQHTQALADLDEKRKEIDFQQAQLKAPYVQQKAVADARVAGNQVVTTAPNAMGLTAQQQREADDRQAQLLQAQRRDAQTARSENTKNAIAAGELNIKTKTFDKTFGENAPVGSDGKPLTGDAFLATLPAGRASTVKAFAEGDLTEKDLPRGNAREPFIDAVRQYDPTFNIRRAQTKEDFGPAGKSGQNIQSLNTAAVHLDQLGEAAKAMGNGSFRMGNKVMNDTVTMFGGAAPTNFDGLKSAVASEMASALKGNATDQEIEAMSRTISASSSPSQLSGIIETNLHTLGAKLNTKDEQYHADPGMGNPGFTPVLPTAQKVFEKHGIQPIQRLFVQPIALKDGTILTPQSKEKADAFRKDHPELIK